MAKKQSLIPLKMGGKVEKILIEKHRGRKGVKDIFSVLGEDIFVAKTHYEEGLGYFYCFEGLCCEYMLPTLRYVVPIYLYPSQNVGNRLGAVRFFALPEEMYDVLLEGSKIIGGKPHYGKWSLVCTDEVYQKITFTLVAKADWHTNEAIKAFVMKELERYKKWITKSIARTIDEQDYKQVTGRDIPADVESYLEEGKDTELDQLVASPAVGQITSEAPLLAVPVKNVIEEAPAEKKEAVIDVPPDNLPAPDLSEQKPEPDLQADKIVNDDLDALFE